MRTKCRASSFAQQRVRTENVALPMPLGASGMSIVDFPKPAPPNRIELSLPVSHFSDSTKNLDSQGSWSKKKSRVLMTLGVDIALAPREPPCLARPHKFRPSRFAREICPRTCRLSAGRARATRVLLVDTLTEIILSVSVQKRQIIASIVKTRFTHTHAQSRSHSITLALHHAHTEPL